MPAASPPQPDSTRERSDLGGIARSIAGQFQYHGGFPRLDDDDFREAYDRIDALPSNERTTVGSELLALALRFSRIGGEAAHGAIAQLFILAAAAYGSGDVARSAFEAFGLGADQMLEAIGATRNLGPAPSTATNSASSLFTMLVDSKR